MNSARPLGVPFRDEVPPRPGPHLHLVPDTLETLLTQVVANLRSFMPETATGSSDFDSACRRDAIAVIEAGRAAGLLKARGGLASGRE